MSRIIPVFFRLTPVLLLLLLTAACASTPYTHESLDSFGVEARAELQVQNEISVRASVPSKEEAEKIFGIPLYKRGIQPSGWK